MNEEIKFIYEELKGYLRAASISEDNNPVDWTRDKSLWSQLNQTIDELNNVTDDDKNYNKFKIKNSDLNSSKSGDIMSFSTYRMRLFGLISKVRIQYFPEEPNPLEEKRGGDTIKNVQSQSQEVRIKIIQEAQSIVDQKLQKVEDGSQDEKFLNELKKQLSSVKNFSGLILTIANLAQDFQIDLAKIIELFS